MGKKILTCFLCICLAAFVADRSAGGGTSGADGGFSYPD